MFRQTLPRGFSRLGSLRSPYSVFSIQYSVLGFLAPRGGSVPVSSGVISIGSSPGWWNGSQRGIGGPYG